MSTTATTAPAKAALPNEGRPGYKHTKLGWIPEEWEVKTLGELGAIAMCKRIFKEETTANGEVPFFKIGTFGGEPDAFITRDKFEEYRRRFSFPKVGDILLSAAGTIGRTVVYDGRPAYFQDSNLVWIENNNEQVLNSYLYYLYPRIKWETDTSTIPRLYNESIRQTRILVPTIPEQRRIAAVLGAWDRAIATVQDLLAAQQERKRGVMQELLTGKRRFPGFGGKWKEVRLGEVVTKSKGSVVSSTEDTSGTPVIDAGSYEGGATLYSTDEHALQCDESDVLLLWDGSKAGRAMTGKKGIVGSTFVLLKPKAVLHPGFLTAILTHDEQRIMAVREGSGIPHVPKDFLRWYRFLLPAFNEQEAIARTIRGMEQIEDSIKAQLNHLTTQKRGLMQQLLTGAVRVKH